MPFAIEVLIHLIYDYKGLKTEKLLKSENSFSRLGRK